MVGDLEMWEEEECVCWFVVLVEEDLEETPSVIQRSQRLVSGLLSLDVGGGCWGGWRGRPLSGGGVE